MAETVKDIVEFTLIYNRYKVKLYNYVMKMIGNKLLTEDIVQNAFLKFFEQMNQIRKLDSSQFWLFKTARNEVFTHYRKKSSHVDEFNVLSTYDTDVVSDFDIALDYEKKELKELIKNALDTLPVEQKDVLLLKEYGDLSYEEIASLLNIEDKLVKSRLYNARQKLLKVTALKMIRENY